MTLMEGMPRSIVAIFALGALALVGCGGSKQASTSKPTACLFTKEGSKLCGDNAVTYCRRYATISNGCYAVLISYDWSHGKGWEARLLENVNAALPTRGR
jgi:hypothetical protein